MAKKLFIFDYDGVIADSLEMCIDTINKFGEIHGYTGKLTKDAIEVLPSVSDVAAFKILGIAPEDYHLYKTDYMDRLKDNAMKSPIFDGIDDIMKLVKANGDILAVNTANGSGTVRRRLELSGLGDLPDFIVGADTEGSKSEKIILMMQKFGISKENTYMIGDSMGDITEGKKAGVHTVAVTYGWQPKKVLEKVNPEVICESVSKLEGYIKKKPGFNPCHK